MSWLKSFIHWGFLFVQLITAILAIRCWNRSRSIAWRFFIIIWVLTFFVETTGKIMGYYGTHNLWLYNIFDVVFYPGIVLLFAEVFKKHWLKLLAFFASAGLFIWSVISLSSQNIFKSLNTYYALVAGMTIIFFALVYLVKSSLDKQSTIPLRNDYYYWFSAGLFIYFIFNAILIGMYNSVLESKVSWLTNFTIYANHLITLVLHLCLWAGFRAALKWMK